MTEAQADPVLTELHDSMRFVTSEVTRLCLALRDSALLDIVKEGNVPGASPFEQVRDTAQNALQTQDMWLLGMGFVGSRSAPGAVAEAMQWWYRPRDGRPGEQLVIGAHPTLTDYYDFENSDWWASAVASSDSVEISGPYIDVAGTNAYVVTGGLSVEESSTFYGVAAIDIEVGGLQTLWQPELLRMENFISVVDSEGTVIATNCGELLGGNVDVADLDGTRIHEVTETPWWVVRT